MSAISLQKRYGADGICFGCGPKNQQGLRIESFVQGEEVVAHFLPASHHQAFPGVLNGGIIGTLLDCHSNWTAAWALMVARGDDETPCTVTADFAVKLRRPTPVEGEISLRAWIENLEDPKARVQAELSVEGKVCATCTGTFVAVGPGHPAYHRW